MTAPVPKDPNFEARGRVIRPGRTITVCNAEIYVQSVGSERLVATFVATMMTVRDRDLSD
jgi:acyl-coenzyme A thioesterase PaaI-like protein